MDTFDLNGFEAIDTCSYGKPEMQICKKYITFTRALVEKMGSPEYVQLLIKPKTQEFALRECKAIDKKSFKFAHIKDGKTQPRYSSAQALRLAIEATMGDNYQDGCFYGFQGEYSPDSKIMIFNLRDAYIRNLSHYERSLGSYCAKRLANKGE